MARTYSAELLARAAAYLAQPERERRLTQASRDELLALYNLMTGERRAWCPACEYSDFYHVVSAYVREATRFFHPETVQDSNYTFAPAFANEQIADGRYSKVVTAENLTDEDAEALLKLDYGHVIVKKGSDKDAKVEADQGSETEVEPENPLVPQADLEKEQEARRATAKRLEEAQATHAAEKAKASDALKAEKEAHKATKKELTVTAGKLGDTEKKLAEAQATIDSLRTPAAPADTTPEPAA